MPPPPRRAAGQAYALFALTLLFVLVGGFAIQSVAPSIGLATTEVAFIFGPAAIFVRRKGVSLTSAFRWRRVPLATLALSLGLGISTWAVAIWIHQAVTRVLGREPVIAALTSTSPAQLAVLLVVAAALPAVCEEALFRGAILGILERQGRVRAVVITAVLFGVFHVDPWTTVPAVFLGLVLGALVMRTGSAVPSIFAHFANNATAVTVGFLLHDRRDVSITPVLLMLSTAFVLLLPTLWVVTTATAAPTCSPLASVPATLAGRRSWWVRAIVLGSAVLLLLIVVAVVRTVDVQRVETGVLEPSLHQGERAILVRLNQTERSHLSNGVIVSYARNGQVQLGRLIGGDTTHVRLQSEGGTVDVDRSAMIGVVVYPMSARHLPGR